MKIVKDFILRDIAGDCVLVPIGTTAQEFNGLITLSDTARFIWENLEKAESMDALIALLLEEYEADEATVRKDAEEFIGELCKAGFVEYTKEQGVW